MADKPNYFAMAETAMAPDPGVVPADAVAVSTCLSRAVYPGCIYSFVGWIKKDMRIDGLMTHESNELLFFVGTGEDKDRLGAELELQIENDHFNVTENCFVYIPKGTAHGNIRVKDLKSPMLFYVCHMDKDVYEYAPAQATAPEGRFKDNVVIGYRPADGYEPEAPEGFLYPLIYIDSKRLAGAPYTEALWFCTKNDTGPAPQIHEDFDEIVAYIGSDPEHPEELNADISFKIDGETVHSTKSTLVYVPRKVHHAPLLVPRLDQRVLHFSGGNGGEYAVVNIEG